MGDSQKKWTIPKRNGRFPKEMDDSQKELAIPKRNWQFPKGRAEGGEEGEQKGRVETARLTVLRGRYHGATIDFLANISTLPYNEVENLIKASDKVYAKWLKKEVVKSVEHLSAAEVRYLIDLFNKNQN